MGTSLPRRTHGSAGPSWSGRPRWYGSSAQALCAGQSEDAGKPQETSATSAMLPMRAGPWLSPNTVFLLALYTLSGSSRRYQPCSQNKPKQGLGCCCGVPLARSTPRVSSTQGRCCAWGCHRLGAAARLQVTPFHSTNAEHTISAIRRAVKMCWMLI